MRGLDFAWGVVPGHEHALARQIRADGFGFVVRYLSYDPSKNLSRAEVEAYRAERIAIVTVWESTGQTALQGKTGGHSDAIAARAALAALGAPADSPVYFAVDFPITTDQMPLLNDYLDAAAWVLGEDRVGVYGGLQAVQAQHARYKWQTYAWSEGQWYPSDRIRQVLNSAGTVQGISYDSDTANGADFGQWQWPPPRIETILHHEPARPKRKPVRTAVRKVVGPVRRVVKREPVVTAAGVTSGLMAAVAFLAKTVGLHLTATDTAAILTALPALGAVWAAFQVRTEHAYQVAVAGLLVAAGTAATAFGQHWPVRDIGADAPVVAAVIAWLLRGHVTPKATATVPAPAAGVQPPATASAP